MTIKSKSLLHSPPQSSTLISLKAAHMNGNYADCIKVSDLFGSEYQLSNDLDELFKSD